MYHSWNETFGLGSKWKITYIKKGSPNSKRNFTISKGTSGLTSGRSVEVSLELVLKNKKSKSFYFFALPLLPSFAYL